MSHNTHLPQDPQGPLQHLRHHLRLWDGGDQEVARLWAALTMWGEDTSESK